jgi:hypothetical protein
MLDRGGGNQQHHFGVVTLHRGLDRRQEFIGFSSLMRHREQTCHHTPRSDQVTVALPPPTVKISIQCC